VLLQQGRLSLFRLRSISVASKAFVGVASYAPYAGGAGPVIGVPGLIAPLACAVVAFVLNSIVVAAAVAASGR